MKNLCTILFLIISFNAFSQPAVEEVVDLSSVTLNVTGANGTIHWQESWNGVDYADITGATASSYTFTIDETVDTYKYYRARITNTLICASDWYSTVIKYHIIANNNFVNIGDWFRGGLVFYKSGESGLIVTNTDKGSSMQWGCNTTSVSASSLTDGNFNTTQICNNCATRPIPASLCNDSSYNGYTDWYLPAKDQLNTLYTQRSSVGMPSSYTFWSSSESTSDKTWGQYFYNGSQTDYSKTNYLRTRCVRSYSSTGNTISYATVTDQPVQTNITTQPLAQTICSGTNATFNVTATGTQTVFYQWKKNGTDITGATASSFTKTNIATADEGLYTCMVSNLCNSVLSNSAQLTVVKLTANAGADAYLCSPVPNQINATATSNHATESGTLSYTWSPSTGLSSNVILNPVADPGTDMTYTLSVTDQMSCSTTDQISVIYSVFVTPVSHPQSIFASIDGTATFSFSAAGTLPQYQWKKNGVNISGATGSTLTIQNLRNSDAGTYTCQAYNSCSSIISDPATLSIYSGHIETILANDSVVLSLYGNPGNIQWQESDDSITWTDIAGATSSTTQQKVLANSTNKKFFRAMITNTLICENASWYSSVIRYNIMANTSQLQVGNWYKGGIVFYVDGSGGGQIASGTDQSAGIAWGCSGNMSASGTLDGALNTTIILTNCATRPIAASLCDSLTEGHYTDWYLPAQIQLTNLCLGKTIIGRFENSQYWSSTEFGSANAKASDFTYCSIGNENKSSLFRTRCIRSVSAAGKVYSYAFPLDPPVTVSITTQPQAQVICLGSDISFSVSAGGDLPYSYQWKKDGADLNGENSSQLTITNGDLSDQGLYTCVVTNLCKSIESSQAELKVIDLSVTINGGGDFCTDAEKHLVAVVTSNHPAESGTITYSWNTGTVGTISDSTIYNPIITASAQTDFYVTVTDIQGCSINSYANVNPIEPAYYVSDMMQGQLCSGNSCAVFSQSIGTLPITYTWMRDNDTLYKTTTYNHNNEFDLMNVDTTMEGNYYLIVSNICNTDTGNIKHLNVVFVGAEIPNNPPLCPGESIVITPGITLNHPELSTLLTYEWHNANSTFTSADPTMTMTADTSINTQMTLVVRDNNYCSSTVNFDIVISKPYQDEEICLVTVDTLVWKNKVLWQGTAGVATSKYMIYKESSFNVYDYIGEVPYGNTTSFIDVASNPESHSDRYKITVVDTCGNESQMSYYHNTMNLIISVFGSTMGLVWTPYQTEDGSYTPNQYYIYKGPSPLDMQLLTTVTGSQNTYNDVNVFDLQYYMIGAERNCNTNPTYSNQRDNGIVWINAAGLSGTILISPNPMTSTTTLTIPNFEIRNPKSEPGFSNFDIRISDVTGKVVRCEPLTPSLHPHGLSPDKPSHTQLTIERGNLKPGVYFVELKADRVYRGKIVVE